ncbi:MAG: hypothetical protein IJF06_06275 [Bacteroidaceae bacterium]|nr:hypothetical protein [Bacteroidaceae bacterium]
MSAKIGIVCEGVSDYKIIKHIVERYLRNNDVYTIPLKPKITAQGKQDGYGTWQGVFKYISGDDQLIVEAVNEGCKYIIIQIDTDVCEEYGVCGDSNNLEELYNNVKNKLNETLHQEINRDAIIYAISINEIECWLIPFISSNEEECSNNDRCLNIVNRHIRTLGTIDKDNKNSIKAQALYGEILSNKKKSKDIFAASRFNYGFSHFIDKLDSIKDLL